MTLEVHILSLQNQYSGGARSDYHVGVVFILGVDDAESECGLDCGVDWDVIIENNGDDSVTGPAMDKLIERVHLFLKNIQET